jgi:hypothetical protein
MRPSKHPANRVTWLGFRRPVRVRSAVSQVVGHDLADDLRGEGGVFGVVVERVDEDFHGIPDGRQFTRLSPRAGGHSVEACHTPRSQAAERYCPYGTAEDVAEFLAPYTAAGCTEFNLIPQAPDHDYAIAGTAAVKRLLAR